MSTSPSTLHRRRVDYDPRGHGYGTVPYITSWSEEQPNHPPMVIRPDKAGIGYATEVLGDRDAGGVLWHRVAVRQGEGRPHFGKVHTTRQRVAMRHLLCQVCARPADESDGGVLWLLPDRTDEPGWPEGVDVTEPPICRPCVALSARLCPRLRESRILFRARTHELTGIYGLEFRPIGSTPIAIGRRFAYLDEPVVAWMRAGQLVRTLKGCTTEEV